MGDEFKDFPESALYMIGAIDEAKKKAPSDKPAAKAKPKADPHSNFEAKSKPEVEHAAADTHGS